jgi:hypothetical protein
MSLRKKQNRGVIYLIGMRLSMDKIVGAKI